MARLGWLAVALFTLLHAGLQAKPWKELRQVQRSEGLYTVVDGYYLRPQKAVQFFEEQGNTLAAALAGEALELQLSSRQVWRRGMGWGALAGGLLGAGLGCLFFNPDHAYYMSREQSALYAGLAGLNVGFFGGMIVGAAQGGAVRREAEDKVARAVSVWIISRHF